MKNRLDDKMSYSIPEIHQLILRTTGELTIEVAKAVKAKEVRIVDIDHYALAKADERRFHTYALDASSNHFPYSNNYFDTITLVETIEHLQNLGHYLIEIKRILKPQGCLMVTTLNIA